MAEYFIIANPAKNQYIDPSTFGDNPKASGYLHGHHPWAVAVLVCNLTQVNHSRGGKPIYGELAGSWCGDAIYAVGDEAGGVFDIGIDTKGGLLRDIIHEEYEDISYAVIETLCHNLDDEDSVEWIAEIVQRTKGMNSEFINLCDHVLKTGTGIFRKALIDTYGDDWLAEYQVLKRR